MKTQPALVIPASALALAIPLIGLAPPTASAATLDLGGCSVNNTATVSPGLAVASRVFTYSYLGTLSNCFYTGTGTSATGGVISAGRTISIDGRQYQEPVPTGSGSCLATTTEGYDFTRWNNGHQTIVKFSATSIAGVTIVTGNVVDSLTLSAINPAPGDPATATFVTDQYNGQNVAGALDFGATNLSACLGSGLTNATITGELTHSKVEN